MARSDFGVTIPFNFERLEHNINLTELDVTGVLKKDELLKGVHFTRMSYHRNEMTAYPILHNTVRDNFGKMTSGSRTCHSYLELSTSDFLLDC